MTITATYSPEDNKLRLYPGERLPTDVYERVKAAGYRWAPAQELFVAPAWTPSREDIALELAGEIDDEDKSLVERAEERADRFSDYSEARAEDGAQARAAVSAIADNIPFGQPILVGHHSEKRARRDAERIENGMRKSIRAFETSEYWKARAKGAVRAAKYKERPDVRARRIKTLEAEERKTKRTLAGVESGLKFWRGEMKVKNTATGEVRLLEITEENRDWILRYLGSDSYHYSHAFPLAKYPRALPASQYEGEMEIWTALGSNKGREHAVCTLDQAKEICLGALNRGLTYCNRWLAHYANRLTYERAMLEADGGTVADRNKPEVGGGVKCWASHGGWSLVQKVNQVSVTVLDNWGNGGGNFTRTIPFDKLYGSMPKTDVEAALSDGRAKLKADGTGFVLFGGEVKQAAPVQPNENQAEIQAMKETLKAGVQVVTAPNLFPTPMPLAEKMVELAELTAGDKVLEPSAGTGNLVHAALCAGIFRKDITAVEINGSLVESLRGKFQQGDAAVGEVLHADFLECFEKFAPGGVPLPVPKYDAILMNPPFDHGSDIKHILHARTFLKPGGKLVALCAAGPKQEEQLQPLADSWTILPDGSFGAEGTQVRVALLTMTV